MSQPENEAQTIFNALADGHWLNNVTAGGSIEILNLIRAALASRASATTPTPPVEQLIEAARLIDLLSHEDGRPADGFRFREGIQSMRDALIQLGRAPFQDERVAQAAAPGGKEPTIHMPMNSGPAPTVVNRNQDYLTDLRHDLQDDEYAFLYLSACAMEGGDTLRLGLRDVKEAWLASHPLQDKPPSDCDHDGSDSGCVHRDEPDFGSAEEVIAGLDRINEHNRQVIAQDKPPEDGGRAT